MASVNPGDVVITDDGALVIGPEEVPGIPATTSAIGQLEQAEADAIALGRPLRQQFGFPDDVTLRRSDPGSSFRDHLPRIGGEIEA